MKKKSTENLLHWENNTTEGNFTLGELVPFASFYKQEKEDPSDSNSEDLCVCLLTREQD